MLLCHCYEGLRLSCSIISEMQPTKCTIMRHKPNEIVKSLSDWCQALPQNIFIFRHLCPITRHPRQPQVTSPGLAALTWIFQDALCCPYFHFWPTFLPAFWDLIHYFHIQLWSYRTQIFSTQVTPSSVTFLQTLDWLEARGQNNSIYRPLKKIKIKNPIPASRLKDVCGFVRIKRLLLTSFMKKITPLPSTQIK